jgi:hypothetical protein
MGLGKVTVLTGTRVRGVSGSVCRSGSDETIGAVDGADGATAGCGVDGKPNVWKLVEMGPVNSWVEPCGNLGKVCSGLGGSGGCCAGGC